MSNTPDLWDVRYLGAGLALELRAGEDPALVLAQGENRVRVELAHVKPLVAALTDAAADLAEVLQSTSRETMRSYQVDLRCPNCRQLHRVSNDLRLDHGPTEPGTLAGLYSTADLPQTLGNLLRDLVWCDQTGKYIEMGAPA